MGQGLGIVGLLLLAGCVSEDQWSFPASRAVYGSMSGEGLLPDPDDYASEDEGAQAGLAAGIVVLMALPLVLDLVILPVTLPRDLIYVGFG